MKNSKLDLNALKAKAAKMDTDKVMADVKGGGYNDCHGWTGQFYKACDWLDSLNP